MFGTVNFTKNALGGRAPDLLAVIRGRGGRVGEGKGWE